MERPVDLSSANSVPAPRGAGELTLAQQNSFAENGFVVIPGAVSKQTLSALRARILEELERSRKSGALFAGGGQLSGHLNCFPGEESRRVYEELQSGGVIRAAKALFPGAVGEPYVGCNLNLPDSVAQHLHVDSVFTANFLIINIAIVDTSLENGAIQLVPRTQQRFYKYWRFVLERKERDAIRVPMEQGDVLLRTSNLWHRGMPNLTSVPRPMMALTWEDGGTRHPDPFRINDGKIAFFPNWYRPTALGRLRERIFVAAPFTYGAWRIARSLVGNKGY